MSRPFVVSQQKLAEKLTILRDRGLGMLTRIYNIKKGMNINKALYSTDECVTLDVTQIIITRNVFC